jgi:hypothetical protein
MMFLDVFRWSKTEYWDLLPESLKPRGKIPGPSQECSFKDYSTCMLTSYSQNHRGTEPQQKPSLYSRL